MAIYLDTFDGTNAKEVRPGTLPLIGNPSEIIRSGIVDEVTGETQEQRTINVYSQLSQADPPGPYNIGTAYSIFYAGLILRERHITSWVDPTIARISLVYRVAAGSEQPVPGQPALISGGAVIEQEDTSFDVNDVFVSVTYNQDTQGGSVPVLRPRKSLSFTKYITTATPGADADTYVGTTNNQLWQGGAAGTWLCESITFDLEDASGPTWRMNFSFRHNQYGWDPDIFYLDESGRPPGDATEGNGFVRGGDGTGNPATVQMYTRTLFDNIGGGLFT